MRAPIIPFAALVLVPILTSTIAAQNSDGAPEPLGILTTVGEALANGGVLMYPIALASVLMLGVAIERIFALRRGKIVPSSLWDEIREDIAGSRIEVARSKVAPEETPLARVLHSALLLWHEETRDVAVSLEEAGMREAESLQKHLPALQGIASVAPLLGLLGTVVGMIQAFFTVAREGALGNPELFARPVGQALVTTAAGLSVAIPALVCFYAFRGRIRKLLRQLDDVARELIVLHRDHGNRTSSTGGVS